MQLVDLTVAVVVKFPTTGFLDLIQDFLDGRTVGVAENLRVLDPIGDREPSFSAFGQYDLALLDLGLVVSVGEADAGKQDSEVVGLLGQSLRLFVAGEVAVAGLHFFVLVLVRGSVLVDELGHQVGKTGSFVHELSFLFRKPCLVIGSRENRDTLQTFRVTRGNF